MVLSSKNIIKKLVDRKCKFLGILIWWCRTTIISNVFDTLSKDTYYDFPQKFKKVMEIVYVSSSKIYFYRSRMTFFVK